MKFKQIVLVVAGLVLLATACVPNRLTQSLPSSAEAGSQALAAPEVAPPPGGRNLQPQLATAQIDPGEVVALLPPDAIRSILPDEVTAIMISAQDADAAGMNPATRVLGISINGQSRAYPIPYMSEHEIVNDEVGGRLIAATW